MDKKRVLFVSYGGGHVHMLAPLIREMQKDERLEPHTIGLTIAAKVYREQYNIDCEGAKDYITEADADMLRFGSLLLKQMQSNGNHVEDTEETIAYLGTSFSDLVIKEGSEEKAWSAYESKGRAAFLPVTFMRRVMDRIQPDLVVTTNSPRGEHAANIIAKERGIKSILISDLFCYREMYTFISDKICVLSEESKNNLMNRYGIEESRISITGNPAFDDSISKFGPIDLKWRKQYLKLDESVAVFLWADQSHYFNHTLNRTMPRSEEDIVETLNVILQAAQNNGLELIVRHHPSQNSTLYKNWCNKNNIQLAADYEINSLIKSVNVVGSIFSTVLLQAYYIGRKVLQLNLDGDKFITNIKNWENVSVAEGLPDISTALRELMSRKQSSQPASASTPSTLKIMNLILAQLSR